MTDQYVVHGILRGTVACLVLWSQVAAGQQLESEAALRAGAVDATERLGREVVKENFSYTIQRMYPRWKKKTAADMGGMDRLVEKLSEVPKIMKRNGIRILSFEPGVPGRVFEVQSAIIQTRSGEKKTIYTEWLVFVPTTLKYLVPDPATGRNVRLQKSGFQVAVSRKEENDWYFIDGSRLQIEELRRLFPALPATKEALGLPPVTGFEKL